MQHEHTTTRDPPSPSPPHAFSLITAFRSLNLAAHGRQDATCSCASPHPDHHRPHLFTSFACTRGSPTPTTGLMIGVSALALFLTSRVGSPGVAMTTAPAGGDNVDPAADTAGSTRLGHAAAADRRPANDVNLVGKLPTSTMPPSCLSTVRVYSTRLVVAVLAALYTNCS